ncbi:hypothetical protein [Undibacterium sp.]|uniref:hypothetical protein n=1 Tax=Undibacterium sp. TaxID=1914977 RepID=UPI00374DE3D1
MIPDNRLAPAQLAAMPQPETGGDRGDVGLAAEYEFSEEDVADLQEQLLARLYDEISGERDEWVSARAESGVEGDWRRAEALYNGEDVTDDGSSGLEDVLRNGPGPRSRTGGGRSRVRINIVAPAVDNQVARMCEILLPVDDKNWGIRPTPNAAVSKALTDGRPVQDIQGNPMGTMADVAASVQNAAQLACKAMEREIDDQLTEAQYNGECRKLIFSAAKLGTGVMKGPFVVRIEERTWQAASRQNGPSLISNAVMSINEKFAPSSRAVDIRSLYPDPSCSDDIQRGKGIYECKEITKKELRALARRPGYNPDAVRKVLRQKPLIVDVNDSRIDKSQALGDLYQIWEYHGEVDPESFQLLKKYTNRIAGDMGDEEIDPLQSFSGCLIIVNDVIIGALPMMTADNSLPYDFFQWKVCDGSPFGNGIPAAKETQQRVVNAAWRQVMDNAGITVGPQLIMKKSAITPQNGKYEIRPNKVWFANDDMDDVRTAFTVVQIESRINELLGLLNAAMQYADQESNTSPMMHGEQQQAGETLGGMSMRWANANGVHRMRVKLFDDKVTRPHIGRYYHWNMQNSEKPDIKGDFEVDARGSSTLIERDIQNQAMANVAAMFQNPLFAPMLKPEDALKATLKSWKLDPNDFMKTDEEIAQGQQAAQQQAAQGQQPDNGPDNQKAETQLQMKQMQLQMKQMEMQNATAQRQHDMQMGGTHDQNRQHEIELQQQNQNARLSEMERSNQVKLQVARMNNQNSANTAMGVAKMRAQQEALKIDSKHQLFNAEAALKVERGSGL